MSCRMSFFWKPGCLEFPGRRRTGNSFCCESLRKMTADRCIALGGHWCCLRTGIGSEGNAHHPLVILLFTEYSWARSGGSVVKHVTEPCENTGPNEQSVSFIFTLPLFYLFPWFLCSAQELSSLGESFHGGQVIRTSRFEFPWEWLICPLLQKGDVVQLLHFLALPQQGSHMTHS